MIPESAEVRSDQPAPSVDGGDAWWEGLRETDAQGHEILHAVDCWCDPLSASEYEKVRAAIASSASLQDADASDPGSLRGAHAESCGCYCHEPAETTVADPGSPSDGGLDVERLIEVADWHMDSCLLKHRTRSQLERCIPKIAAEYALLSGSPSESEG